MATNYRSSVWLLIGEHVLDSGWHQLILGREINLHSEGSCAIAHLWSTELVSFLTQCGTRCGGEGLGTCNFTLVEVPTDTVLIPVMF